jgi:hypothetical protein
MNNDILNTSREHRLDEQSRVFRDMQRLLQRIMDGNEISGRMDVHLSDDINAVLDRAALVAF